ncbi:SGNH/GDSL hydrolase family protein [Enterococcus faecalis]|uniref:SGNH/GDSL hydrolase family protein n=1 Tax=Enterococcus faecalis TaxID=1351 RepID=UPI0004597297|nr:SGNH/GDSL hydrolase family protein [Enterococcus faecalis]KAJ80425.1 Phage minor structural protein [Enterococcus faecalis MTUP9]
MTKLNENLPLDGRDMRLALDGNFHLLNEIIDFKDRQTLEQLVRQICDLYIKTYDKEIHQEIRAIITPDLSPLQITQEVLAFRKDSQGIEQSSMSARLMAEIQYLIAKYLESSDIWKKPIAVDDSGRITTNYLAVSYVKQAKRIGIIGDSVARGYLAKYNFGDLFKKVSGATVTNTAVNGARMTNNNEASIYAQSKKVGGCDLVIIQGTDDDWLGNVPIGSKYDDENTSYIGAFYRVVDNIRALNPNAKILVMTSTLQAPASGGSISRTDRWKNKLGKDLHDYTDAQKMACNDLQLPYADFMKTELFEPLNPAFRKKMMSEGLHPNEIGHQMIAQELAKQIYYFYG